MSENTGEQFLHQKNPKLHTTVPVEHEQTRRKLAGEKVSQKPADKIANFLGIIEKTHMGHNDDPRVLDRIKGYYHKEYVIKPENIPDSYWNLQGEIAINEGRKQDLIHTGVVIEENTVQNPDGTNIIKRSFTFPEDVKEQATRTVIANQEQSLDKWVNYLTSGDAPYPMWAKYWAFRSLVKMGKLEKTEDGKARFANREKNTVASFPVLNQRALANTVGAMSTRLEAKGRPEGKQTTENLSAALSDEEYQKLLSTEDFSKLYAQFLSEIPEYSTQGLEETRGKWVKYTQGSNPDPLVKSLDGHPLEWCTADIDTARTQLKGGAFYVYYSLDSAGKPTIPRAAIRMEGARIAEPPRGIAPNQNLDPFIFPVLETKLEEFGSEGQAFKKRTSDMKQLTQIEQKTLRKEGLSAEELKFLYELDSRIEGFGYEKDPRIEELRKLRNSDEDMPIVFGCETQQIANNPRAIRPDTKAYVGSLQAWVFELLAKYNIDHVYTKFPEGKVQVSELTIGVKSKQELLEDLKRENIQVSRFADDMIKNPDFTTLQNPETIKTVRITVQDLGFDTGTPTTDQIYKKADELGLDLCLPEVGVYQRLQDKNQPDGWYSMGMKQITDSDGRLSVFELGRDEDELWLDSDWAGPDRKWNRGGRCVFSLRKSSEPQNTPTLSLLDRLFRR